MGSVPGQDGVSRKALVERENVGFDLTKFYLCPSFIKGHTTNGVELHVADSHTGNHREDDFTPLETIQSFIGIIGSRGLRGVAAKDNETALIGSRSISSSKGRPSSQKKGLGLLAMPSGKGREREKDKAYIELEMKCNDALQDLDKNSLVRDMRAEIETLQGKVYKLYGEYSRLVLKDKKWVNYEQILSILHSKVKGLEVERERLKKFGTQLLQEVDGLRQDRVAVVANVVPHVAMELIHSDEMRLLVARLAKAALFHGMCSTLEEVATLKEPFKLEKMPGYRPLSKKEFDQAGDNLATVSYPFLAKANIDPYAPLEVLILKKPMSL
ncbi:hypothetical protein Tco_1116080 [Tanacetum coccineum]